MEEQVTDLDRVAEAIWLADSSPSLFGVGENRPWTEKTPTRKTKDRYRKMAEAASRVIDELICSEIDRRIRERDE